MEEFMRQGIEGGLGEIEEAGQTDDEAVDFTEGLKTEDFGGVVAVRVTLVSVCARGAVYRVRR